MKDASVLPHTPGPGDVTVTVLAHDGDGTPDVGTIAAVNAALSGEEHRPRNDTVVVSAAGIVPYRIEASLTLYEGPDEAAVLVSVREAVAEFVARHHRLGHDITRSCLFAAMHLPGAVQRIDLISPAADIVIAWPAADPILTIGGRDV